MPCYDPRDRWDEEHNNYAAELLCEILKKVPYEGYDFIWTQRVRNWWKDHLDRDSYYRRKEKE